MILTLLVIPAYYFGIRGEGFIDLMRQIDPLLNHSGGKFKEAITAILEGSDQILKLNGNNIGL